MTRPLRIGTRGSALALAQAQWVQEKLQQRGHEAELVVIKTTGDRVLDQPLSAIGGKGVFVKEIEEALLAGTIDCAVHSLKDVPSELPVGLLIAAVPPREDPRDVLVCRERRGLEQLASSSRIGTSSLRRMALVRACRHDLSVLALRGNIDSRLRKLDAGQFDALVLAAAGLRRLGIERAGVSFMDPQTFIPAIGQGALAIESRSDETTELLAPLDHHDSHIAVTAERAFLRQVGGSCHTPLAAHATLTASGLELRALIAAPDGSKVIRGQRHGAFSDAATLGGDLAAELLGRGGAAILQALEAR